MSTARLIHYVALSAASLGAIAALLLIRKHRKTEE